MLITWARSQVALEVPPVAAGVAAPGSASASCEHVASGHSEAPAATAAGDGHSEAPPAPGSASAFGAVGGEGPGANPHFSHFINRGRTAIAHPVAELWAQALPGQHVRWRRPSSLSLPVRAVRQQEKVVVRHRRHHHGHDGDGGVCQSHR